MGFARIRHRGLRWSPRQSARVDEAIGRFRTSGRQQGDGGLWQEIAAQREAVFGNASEGKQAAAQGLKLYPDSQGVEVEAALAFALAGDVAQAESLAQDLNQRFPLDTQIQLLWLPAIRAQVALNRKNPGEALAVLQNPRRPLSLVQFPLSLMFPVSIQPTFAAKRISRLGRASRQPPSSRNS